MKIFIPPLGTIITLGKAWTFTLYCENRNAGLGRQFDLMVKTKTLREFCAGRGLSPKGDASRFDFLLGETWEAAALEAATSSHSLYDSLYALSRGSIPAASVTLPVGTDLTVDRIYIRRGCAKFDSVSFRAGVPPGALVEVRSMAKDGVLERRVLGKTKTRFWAKLPEVNQIEYNFITFPAGKSQEEV